MIRVNLSYRNLRANITKLKSADSHRNVCWKDLKPKKRHLGQDKFLSEQIENLYKQSTTDVSARWFPGFSNQKDPMQNGEDKKCALRTYFNILD